MIKGTAMKPAIGNQSIIIITCVLLFIALFYAQRLGLFLSFGSNFNEFKSPLVNNTEPESNIVKGTQDHKVIINNTRRVDECDVTNGKWVFNHSIKAMYSDASCPYISRPFSCVKNGRKDSDYLYWEWQPQDCTLPKFNPEVALKKLQGKRLLFVGDSLQQSQWESFVCMIEWIIPRNQKSMKRGTHSVFKAKEYNATIEFYWAPMLVESNTEFFVVTDPKKKIVKVDSIMERAKNWMGVDILVFNTYIWWLSSPIKALWGSFANGEEGYEELETEVAYNLALRTWANWVDSTINPNKTRVFFTTMSPLHIMSLPQSNIKLLLSLYNNCFFKSADWGNKDGVNCFKETKPSTMEKNHWGSGSKKSMMNVVAKVVKRMKVPVTFINITQISEYRIDAHPSVYGETRGNVLTKDDKNNAQNADCFHWCLPGVPDTWNQIFLAML